LAESVEEAATLMNENIFISYQPKGIYIIERSGMHFRKIGGLQIYTPRASEEVNVRMILEEKLRRKTKPGNYTRKGGQQNYTGPVH
jgi:hypothetical protein